MKADASSHLAFRSLSAAGPGTAAGVVSRLRALSFWLAVALPWVLLGFVLTGGAGRWPGLFVGLVLATLAFASLGHGHAR